MWQRGRRAGPPPSVVGTPVPPRPGAPTAQSGNRWHVPACVYTGGGRALVQESAVALSRSSRRGPAAAVITGMGEGAPNGIGVRAFVAALRAGVSGVHGYDSGEARVKTRAA